VAKDLDQLTGEELGQLFPIQIVEWRAEWLDLFNKESAHLLNILGEERALRIEHIGSTAVPGLAAKPTIDILIEIQPDEEAQADITALMQDHAYIHMREQQDHLMFVKGYTPAGYKGQAYHIHMASKEQEEFWERLDFRDYLIAHPEAADAYAALKRKLAEDFHTDREAYTEAKTGFIRQYTDLAKNWRTT
jgi:GrpB-like predicted nucleotidyltransferase (UPF0157 family)